jgi:hypothetical protein
MKLYSRRGVSTLSNFPETGDMREMFRNEGYVVKFALEKVGLWLDVTDQYPEKWVSATLLRYNSFVPEYFDDWRRDNIKVNLWKILSEKQ